VRLLVLLKRNPWLFFEAKTGTRVKFKKLFLSVGTESVWCSRAYSDFCKPLVYKQGEEIYDDLNANWRLPKRSAQWSWIVRIYLDLSLQLRNRQGSVCPSVPPCSFRLARCINMAYTISFLLETQHGEIVYISNK